MGNVPGSERHRPSNLDDEAVAAETHDNHVVSDGVRQSIEAPSATVIKNGSGGNIPFVQARRSGHLNPN
jgi:hypothetical protein